MISTRWTVVCSVLWLGLSSGCVSPAVPGGFHAGHSAATCDEIGTCSTNLKNGANIASSGKGSRGANGDRAKIAAQRAPSRATQALDDAKRNDADFRIAQARWRRDDLVGCRLLLASVLARDPGHRDAVLLSAELALLEGRPLRAEPSVRKLCIRRRDDARAQHLLAMLLDCAGRRAEAIDHYELAAQLDPDDSLYQLSLGAATASDADILVRHGLAPPAAAVAGASEDLDHEPPAGDSTPADDGVPGDDGAPGDVGQVIFNEFVEDAGDDGVGDHDAVNDEEPAYLEIDELPAPLRSARMTASMRGLPALRRGSREYAPAPQRPAAAGAVATDVESPAADE